MQLIRLGCSSLYSLMQYYKTYVPHISYYSFYYFVIPLSHFKVCCSHFFITSHLRLAPFMLLRKAVTVHTYEHCEILSMFNIEGAVLQMTSLTIKFELRFILHCSKHFTW